MVVVTATDCLGSVWSERDERKDPHLGAVVVLLEQFTGDKVVTSWGKGEEVEYEVTRSSSMHTTIWHRILH